MSQHQRKLSILQTLLERVQERAAAPRTRSSVVAMTAVATVAASATAEAFPIEEPDQTPLVASVDSLADELALRPAEELTPSEEIVIIDLSSVPPPIVQAELEVVEDDELASEAALIEEALSASEDEEPVSSEQPRAMHSLEAAMAPMELDPISDRPTARITLPPESGPQLSSTELAPAKLPTFADAASATEEEAAELEPEISVSSEPAEITWSEAEELIELGPADEIDFDEASSELEIVQEEAPAGEPVLSVPAEPPTLNRSVSELSDPFEDDSEADSEIAEPESVADPAEPLLVQDLAEPFEEDENAAEAPRALEAATEEALEVSPVPPAATVSEVRVASEPPADLASSEPAETEQAADIEPAPEPVDETKSTAELSAEIVQRPASASTEVATFVAPAESFAPKSFVELLDASLEL